MFPIQMDPEAFPAHTRAIFGIEDGDRPVWLPSAARTAAVRLVNCSRRDFLRTGAAAAGSVFVLGLMPGCATPEELEDLGPKAPPSGPMGEAEFQPNLFVALNSKGDVFLVNSRAEMGQGTKTGMTATLADEMDADWDRVHVVQADGDPKYGPQSTGGSQSVRLFFQDWRKAGATARAMLVSAAALTWEVDEAECETGLHLVRHVPTGRELSFGALASAASTLPVPEAPPLKARDQWRYIGKAMHGVDNHAIVTGAAQFGADVRVPDLKFAVIARSPVLGGRLVSYDDSAARAVPGVLAVFEVPAFTGAPGSQALGGVAVVAENTWAALKGRDALSVSWDPGPNAVFDSDTYREALLDTVTRPGRVDREQGDVDAALAAAGRVVEATYYTAMLEHAPMEPPATLAWVKADGTCEAWCSTQDPQTARNLMAEALGVDAEQVALHMTLLGGAFGRKGLPDFAPEAALVSKQHGGPVLLTWSREDAMRHGYYHPPAAQHFKAAVDTDGRVTGWLHRTAFPAIGATFTEGAEYGGIQGARETMWAIPNLRIENGPAKAHVRIGWLRSVMAVHHGFGIGAFVGELAHALGRDQKDMWLELLGPDRVVDELMANGRGPYGEPPDTHPVRSGRLRGVLELAAEKAGWGQPLPEGQGMGIAAHYSFWGYAAFVVRVAVDGSRVRVLRVDAAIDCGTVVNPDRVRAQQEGAVVFSLTHALHSEIIARGGAIVTGNFDEYPLLELRETPETHVYLVESTEPSGGVGEPGIPPMMPALTNAILAATGTPVRELPIRLA
jgi:isoquinoline 1-oxidoreductase beta subunit